MAKIKSVEVCVARVPLDSPVSFSTRTVLAREYCLVRITADDGTAGIGYSYAVNKGGRLLALSVLDLFGPKLIGEESTRVEGIWRDLYHDVLLLGRAGAIMRALSAVDIALWDLNARCAKLPLYQYLGAVSLDSVAAYASGGYYWPGKSNDMLASEFGRYASEGFKAVKMKTGRLSVSEEAARVAAVREAIGPDTLLMLDANNAWRDMPEAMLYMRRLEKYEPFWIEEPFSPDDIDNHARLSRATSVPVATGEIEAGRWRFKDLLSREATTLMQVDATVCGGISEWRKVAATCSAYEVSVAPHAWHDVHIHLVASTANATYVEFMPDDHIVNFRRLIDRQIVAEQGRLVLPREPGLGFDFDDDAVAKYGVPQAGHSGVWMRSDASDG